MDIIGKLFFKSALFSNIQTGFRRLALPAHRIDITRTSFAHFAPVNFFRRIAKCFNARIDVVFYRRPLATRISFTALRPLAAFIAHFLTLLTCFFRLHVLIGERRTLVALFATDIFIILPLVAAATLAIATVVAVFFAPFFRIATARIAFIFVIALVSFRLGFFARFVRLAVFLEKRNHLGEESAKPFGLRHRRLRYNALHGGLLRQGARGSGFLPRFFSAFATHRRHIAWRAGHLFIQFIIAQPLNVVIRRMHIGIGDKQHFDIVALLDLPDGMALFIEQERGD